MIRGSPCKSNTRNTGKEGNMDHHKSTTGPQVLQAADRSTRVTTGSPQSPCNYSEPQPQLIGVAGAEGVLAARCTAAAGRGPSEASNGRLCSPSGVSHRSSDSGPEELFGEAARDNDAGNTGSCAG